MKELIKDVKSHAFRNYKYAGWDDVVDYYSDDDLFDIIEEARATTLAGAVEAVRRAAGAGSFESVACW